MAGHRTTEDLRETLFDCIGKVIDGTMDIKQANAVASLSKNVIGTMDLELKYAALCSKLDKEDQGVSVGPLLLTQQKEDQQ